MKRWIIAFIILFSIFLFLFIMHLRNRTLDGNVDFHFGLFPYRSIVFEPISLEKSIFQTYTTKDFIKPGKYYHGIRVNMAISGDIPEIPTIMYYPPKITLSKEQETFIEKLNEINILIQMKNESGQNVFESVLKPTDYTLSPISMKNRHHNIGDVVFSPKNKNKSLLELNDITDISKIILKIDVPENLFEGNKVFITLRMREIRGKLK